MRIFVLGFALVFCLVVQAENEINEVSVQETGECLDRLENCAVVASKDFCESTEASQGCARSCGLCANTHFKAVRSKARSNAKKNSNSHSNTHAASRPASHAKAHSNVRAAPRSPSHAKAHSNARAHAKQNSRARGRSNARTNAKAKSRARPTASKAKARARRPASKAKAKSGKPQTKSAPKTNNGQPKTADNKAGRRPKNKKPKNQPKPQPSTQQNNATVQANAGVKFQPIGPNQIKTNVDVMLGGQMSQTKKDAAQVNNKLSEVGKNVDMVVQGLDQAQKQIEEEEKKGGAATSKIQLNDAFSEEGLNLVESRNRAVMGSFAGTKWTDTVQNIAKGVDTLMGDIKTVVQDSMKLADSVQIQQMIANGGNKVVSPTMKLFHVHMVKRIEEPTAPQGQQKPRPNLVQSLGGFATDFGKCNKDVDQVQKDLTPIIAIIQNLLKMAQSNDLSGAKKLVVEVSDGFKKIKVKVQVTVDTFKKASDDFGGVADNFEKSPTDMQAPRKPASEGATNSDNKSPDQGKQDPSKPDQGKQDPTKTDQTKQDPTKADDKLKDLNGKVIRLKCKISGSYVTLGAKPDYGMLCNKKTPDENDQFTVEEKKPKIAFKAKHDQYCSGNDKTAVLTCNQAKAETNNEQFTRVDNNDGTISLKCSNDKFITVTGDEKLDCSSQENGEKQSFTVELVEAAKDTSGAAKETPGAAKETPGAAKETPGAAKETPGAAAQKLEQDSLSQ